MPSAGVEPGPLRDSVGFPGRHSIVPKSWLAKYQCAYSEPPRLSRTIYTVHQRLSLKICFLSNQGLSPCRLFLSGHMAWTSKINYWLKDLFKSRLTLWVHWRSFQNMSDLGREKYDNIASKYRLVSTCILRHFIQVQVLVFISCFLWFRVQISYDVKFNKFREQNSNFETKNGFLSCLQERL
jgi:hypothetical protein